MYVRPDSSFAIRDEFHRTQTSEPAQRTVPLGDQRQKSNAGEEVAQEGVLLHAHEAGRRRRAQAASRAKRHMDTHTWVQKTKHNLER